MAPDQEALLNAALIHVPFDGMNDRALAAGARDIGVDAATARLLFPRGGADLAAAYHRRADARLRDWLEATPPQGRFREQVTQAVWHRLSLVQPDLVRAGAATLALPQNAGLAARLVWDTADIIWRGLGDTSTDANWYTKRATLSAVISSTVLYWLGDTSADHEATRSFLDRRIEGVMRFEKLRAQVRNIPGAETLGNALFGWVRAPQDRELPGKITR